MEPVSSPTFLRYSDIASAAAKWIPMVRCLLPFFVDRQGHLLTVLGKSFTCSRQVVASHTSV